MNNMVFKNEATQMHGSPTLSQSAFGRLQRLLFDKTGIHLTDDKVNLVESRLQKRMRELNCSQLDDYLNRALSDDGADELDHLICSLTTNVTRFFRESHHFDHLQSDVFPELIDRAKSGQPVRFWSAGCSSGQEVLSIAMALQKEIPNAHQLDVRFLASDIDKKILLKAQEGIYSEAEVDSIPPDIRDRFFSKSGQDYQVSPETLSMVSYRALNLNAKVWPMTGKFDVIFCRNTVIYFTANAQQEVWGHLIDYLKPGGYIFTGHSEVIAEENLSKIEKIKNTVYRRRNSNVA